MVERRPRDWQHGREAVRIPSYIRPRAITTHAEPGNCDAPFIDPVVGEEIIQRGVKPADHLLK